jgi:hypothetical protein
MYGNIPCRMAKHALSLRLDKTTLKTHKPRWFSQHHTDLRGFVVTFAISYSLLLGVGCASLNQPDTTRLTLTGGGGAVTSSHSRELRQGGLHVVMEHQKRTGYYSSVTLSSLHSVTTGTSGDSGGAREVFFEERDVQDRVRPGPQSSLAKERFNILGAGLKLGFTQRHWSVALGAHLIYFDQDGFFPVPSLTLRFGNLEEGWFEINTGFKGSLLDAMVASMGGHVKTGAFDVAFGIGVGIKFVDPENRDGIQLIFNDAVVLAGYLNLSWVSDMGVGLALRTYITEDFSVQLGLTFDLDKLFRSTH